MAVYRRMLWLAACLAALLAWPGTGAARDSHKKPAKSDKPSSHQRAAKGKATPSRRKGGEKPHVRFNPPPDNEHDLLLPEFEQDAAELRQWLRQRDTERQMVGDAEEDSGTADEASASAETDDSVPRRLDLSLAPRHGRHPGPQQIAGRRRHVLDPSRSIHLSLDPDGPLQLEDMELYDPSELPSPRKAKAKPAHKEKLKEKQKPAAKRDSRPSGNADAKSAKKKPAKEKSAGKRRHR